MPEPVGRDDVLAQLCSLVEDGCGGAGRLLLLTGEAGIGKTAMLAETARHGESLGATVAWGWGWPDEGAPAYWPWIQVLRGLGLESSLSPTVAAGADRSPTSARFALFDEVCTQLITASRQRPIVLLLDDLQWADPPSLLLLDFLSRRLPSARVAVIGSYRGAPAGGNDALATLAAHSAVLPLSGLPPAAVAQLVAGVLGRQPTDEMILDVHRRTGGNPFFAHQLAWLIRDGQHGVPPGVREAIRQRYELLSAGCLGTMSIAAVVGQRFSAALLAEVTGASVASVTSMLAEAVRAGLLDQNGHYRFAHDLFREYLYDELTPAARVDAHTAIARVLDAGGAPGDEVSPAEVAWHFVHADATSAQALRASVTAAREAAARLAYEDAVRHWERAAHAGGDESVEILLELAEARRQAGNADAAAAEFWRVVDLARRSGGSIVLAHAALGLHAIGSRMAQPPGPIRAVLTRHPELIASRPTAQALAEVLDEAHRALATERADERLLLRVQACLARVLAWHDLDLPRARQLAAEAGVAARELDDPHVLAACLLAEHNAVWSPDTARHRRELAGETAAIGRQIADPDVLIEAQLLLATDVLELGDAAFRASVDEFLRLAEASGQPRLRYAALVRRAMLAQMAVRFDEAERLAGLARDLGTEYGEPDASDVWYTQMWDIRTEQRRRGELTDAAAGAHDPGSRAARGFAVLGQIAAGVRSMSAHDMATLLDDDPQRPAPGSRRFVIDLIFAADAATALGDAAVATRVYDALSPFADYTVVAGAAVSFRGSVCHYLGLLAMATGRRDLAEAHLRAALAVHERLGALAWTLRSRYELARLHLNAPATRRDARRVLVDIAAEARTLSMSQLSRDAEAAADTATTAAVLAGSFTRDGAVWTLEFAAETVRMRDAKGLRDLATLLATPGQPVAAADLMAVGAGAAARADLGMGADEIFDATARRQIRGRLADLDRDIDEAEQWSDLERAARARAEKDALIHELSAAAGLSGGPRRLGDQWERARKAVTARIRDIIDRIDAVHPELASHLRESITTGTHCTYSPPAPVTWRL